MKEVNGRILEVLRSSCIVSNSMIGLGILRLPHVVLVIGPYWTSVLLFIVAIITMVILYFLFKVSRFVERYSLSEDFRHSSSDEESNTDNQDNADQAIYYSNLLDIFNCPKLSIYKCLLVLFVTSYCVLVAAAFLKLLYEQIISLFSCVANVEAITVILIILILFFSTFKIGWMSLPSVIAVVMVIFMVILSILYLLFILKKPGNLPKINPSGSATEIFEALSSVLFAFTCQSTFMPIYSNIKNRSESTDVVMVIIVSVGGTFILYLIFALCTSYSFGNDLKENSVLSLSCYDSGFSETMQILFIIKIVFDFPLMIILARYEIISLFNVVIKKLIQKKFFKSRELQAIDSTKFEFKGFCITIVLIITSFALLIADQLQDTFKEIVMYLSSIIGYGIPFALFLAFCLRKYKERKEVSLEESFLIVKEREE